MKLVFSLLLILLAPNLFSQATAGRLVKNIKIDGDPKDDAVIISGSKYCNAEWKAVDIKNKSTTKFLTITVQETTTRQGSGFPPSVKTLVFSKLAPQEQKELGCSGCGSTTTGELCVSYKVVAAVYVAP